MATLCYHVATTVDGYIASTDGSWAAFLSEGPHIPDYLDALDRYGSVVMGRRTYEVGLGHGVTNPYPKLATYVLSTALGASPDPAVTVVADDAVAFIRAHKRDATRPIYLCGGSQLAGALFAAGLVDELIIKQNPVVLGAGIPLFAGVTRATPLALRDCRTYANGVVVTSFRVAAPAPT